MIKKQIVFIVNPHAGMGKYRKLQHLLPKRLDLRQFEYTLLTTHYRGHAKVLAEEAVKENVDIVVAVGGDGTINEIARILVGTKVYLGIIPTGSGNGLAHHLHIPVNIKKAIQVINQADYQLIDVIAVNEKICTSVAGMGFDAHIAELFDKDKRRGFFTYLRYIAGHFFTYPPKTYLIEQKDKAPIEHTNALMVTIANSSQWGFNVQIVPKASLQDGLADVCIIEKPPFFSIGFRLMMLLSGRLHLNKLAVHTYRFRECTLVEKSANPQPCHIDGDPVERCNRMQIQVLPNALYILTPGQELKKEE